MLNRTIRVYIVEDEPLVLNGYIAMLQGNGIDVVGYSMNAKGAMEAIPALRPDVAILDINLPDGNGIETVENIQKSYRLPCILITGYQNSKQLVDRAAQIGVYGYLHKPVDEVELISMIKIALNRFQEEQQMRKQTTLLQESLENRKIIERAKGALIDEFSMKEADAMKYLQKKSRDTNLKMIDVAKSILSNLQKF